MIRILSLQKFSAKKVNQLEFYNPQIVFRTVIIVDFTSSGTWTVPEGVTEIEYLVVGGGGSGGPFYNYGTSSYGGNGGSGVVIIRYVSNLVLAPALGSGRVNATTATYRAPTAFTVNAPVNGKATFYERNKVISTCKNKTAVAGGTVTCTWKPSVRGKVSLRVDYYQTGSTTLLERSNFEVWVNNRSGSR